jgi:GxxExxY protein
MPVSTRFRPRRLSQAEFGEIAFEILRHVFAIHRELGRFFGEPIYKRELEHRVPGVRFEEPIDVTYGKFHKRLYIDALVGDGAPFEFKAVDALTGAHRAQLMQYLMLCELAHGKLINMRSESVTHEFVNSNWTLNDRRRFEIDDRHWRPSFAGAAEFHDFMIELLRDLGTGLTIPLYEEAATSCEADVRVFVDDRTVGEQHIRLAASDTAVRVTAFESPPDPLESHMRNWLAHLDVRELAWLNIGKRVATFTSISK